MFRRDSAIMVQARIVSALILRDLRTRYGRSFIGYVIIVGWPLSHLLFLVAFYTVIRRLVPLGTDSTVFFATGVLPYILCVYPGRQIMTSILVNRPLLSFPIIKASDLVIARSIVEVITAFWVVTIFCGILYLFNVDFMPVRIEDAVGAILATVYLGFAVGWLGAVLFACFRAWMAFQFGLLILMYITAGVFFIPTNQSKLLQTILYFNPLLHCVEWMRSAYYEGYGYGLLDPGYLIGFSSVIMISAMALERAIRGRLLQQ